MADDHPFRVDNAASTAREHLEAALEDLVDEDAIYHVEQALHLTEPDHAIADGSGQCGKRSCTRAATQSVPTGSGGIRARCFRHALEELAGIGPTKAEQLASEFDDLQDLCTDIRHGSSVRIARLDGFSPDSAQDVKNAIQKQGLWTLPTDLRLEGGEA